MPIPATLAVLGTSAVRATDAPDLEKAQKLAHRGRSAFVILAVAGAARAANRHDSEMLQGEGLRAGVFVPGDERRERAHGVGPCERHHQMLPVPHRRDQRRSAPAIFVEILGNGRKAARAPYEPQIGCEQEADRLLAELRPA